MIVFSPIGVDVRAGEAGEVLRSWCVGGKWKVLKLAMVAAR